MGRKLIPTGFSWESQKERDEYEYLVAGEMIILKCILEKWDGMDWIHLAQDMNQ
jgi:hypothetical protein